MGWLYESPPGVLAGLFFVLALLAAAVAYPLARRLRPDPDEQLIGQLSGVEGAILGLLGLLLAFSFSMAVERFEVRRGLVVKEANAIGTAYLRTDALPLASRAEAEALLHRYVDARLAFFRAGEDGRAIADAVADAEAIQWELWHITAEEAEAAPASLPIALFEEAVNAVIDIHAERLAAHEAHVPDSILTLLVGVGVVGIGMVGFVFGLFRGPYLGPSVVLALLTAGILYVIVDLDRPRQGHIRVSQASMERLKASFADR